MNKKGQISSLGISIIVAIVLFIAGMMTVNIIKGDVTTTRNDLQCSGDISDGTKMLCLVVDFVVPYFFIFVISAAGGLITYRFLL
jgi:hypothetical protein